MVNNQLTMDAELMWKSVAPLGAYLLDVKQVPMFSLQFPLRVPFNFFFESPLGVTRRLVGLSGSPLSTGYFLMMPVLITFGLMACRESRVVFRRGTAAVLILMSLGLALTITRGAIIGACLGAAVLVMLRRRGQAKLSKGLLVGAVLMFAAGISLVPKAREVIVMTISGEDLSLPGHLSATERGLSELKEVWAVGRGLGSAGGAAQLSGSMDVEVGENAYLVIVHQIGLPGLLLFLLWSSVIIGALNGRRTRTDSRAVQALVMSTIAALSGYLFSGLFSEQLLTFTSLTHFWLWSGALLSLKKPVLETRVSVSRVTDVKTQYYSVRGRDLTLSS